MPGDDLARRQNQSLCSWGIALVSGLLDYAESLEMHPHRVSWICDSSVRKGIRYEEISEFIMNDWFRDMQNGQKCNPKKQCRESHHGHAKPPFFRQAREAVFQAVEKL
jgi:hypothetical protein